MQFCAICRNERAETPCETCATDDAPWTKLDAENQPAQNGRYDVQFIAGHQREDWRFRDGVFEAKAQDRGDFEDAPLAAVGSFRPHVPGRPEQSYLKQSKKALAQGVAGVKPEKRKT